MLDLPCLSKYFPTDRAEPCYAVYAPAIDRFLMVDGHDLPILLRAAMLFSSKIVTLVCAYDTKTNPPLEALEMREPLLRRHHGRRNYTMRLLRYPGVKGPVKEGQARCGEHTDWGTITLLFQGDEDGLEIQRRSGEWTPAAPMPGTVLVNIGDELQTWSQGTFVSTPHRVRADSLHSGTDRYSIALFCYADFDAPIEIGDAHTSGDYLLSKLARTQSAGTVAAA